MLGAKLLLLFLGSSVGSSHLPAVGLLPGHGALPWETVAVWLLLLLHLVLAVTGYVQCGVVMAAILHKAKFISMELGRDEYRVHGNRLRSGELWFGPHPHRGNVA